MARAAHGTWLGVTRHGRIAVLTNYKEDSTQAAIGQLSRGEIINSFLEQPPPTSSTSPSDPENGSGREQTEEYVSNLIAGGQAHLAGGFSLACGTIRGPLAIVSNRVCAGEGCVEWVATAPGQTVALSNTAFGDRSWAKIRNGEALMKDAVQASVKLGEGEEAFVQRLLGVLSTDTLPRMREEGGGGDLETYMDLLCESIFIPMIGEEKKDEREEAEVCASHIHEKAEVMQDTTATTTGAEKQATENGTDNHMQYMQGLYGTQKQTVVLVHRSGRVKFFERTLYDDNAKPIPIGQGDRTYEFMAEE